MQDNLVDSFVDEEINKSIQKIKNVFNYGMQQSSSIFIPEEKHCTVSFQTSLEPFHVHEKSKEAEQTFHQVLESVMEQRQLPQFLFKILQEQKQETILLLGQYDLIISELSKNLTQYDKEYRQKCEKHSFQHELLQENIEKLISEINRIGKEEIQNIRTSIIQNTKNKADTYWKKCQKRLDESAADIPFDNYLWKPPTTMLPFQELVDTFSLSQEEVFDKRSKMLSEICVLRKNFEKERLEYALKLEKFEKELFEIKENYKRKKLAFANLKRKQYRLISRKEKLCKELKDVTMNIEKECETQKKIFEKYNENKRVKSHLKKEENLKYESILKDRYMEVYNILIDVANSMNMVTEQVLEVFPNPTNLEGFDVTHEQALPYVCKKDHWSDFIDFAPKDALLDDILKMLNRYWIHKKDHSDILGKKKSLYLENKELFHLLEQYHFYENTHSLI